MIHRRLDGIDPGGPQSDIAKEKQQKFCQFFSNQLSEHNKQQFNLTWTERNIEILKNWFKYTEEELNEKIYEVNSDKLIKYYQKFNSTVTTRLKNLVEQHIHEETAKNNEKNLYNEISRHLCKFQNLAQEI